MANEYKKKTEIDAILSWDTTKLQIRSSSLYYAKKKNAKMKTQEISLEADMLALQMRPEKRQSFRNRKSLNIKQFGC